MGLDTQSACFDGVEEPGVAAGVYSNFRESKVKVTGPCQ